MEDAIDDWLLMQINWLRREDIVAEGIRWVKDVSVWIIRILYSALSITCFYNLLRFLLLCLIAWHKPVGVCCSFMFGIFNFICWYLVHQIINLLIRVNQ